MFVIKDNEVLFPSETPLSVFRYPISAESKTISQLAIHMAVSLPLNIEFMKPLVVR